MKRKQIGKALKHEGRTITAHFLGPDLLMCIDGLEFPNFYLDTAAVHAAGVRHIDAELKAARDKERGAKK